MLIKTLLFSLLLFGVVIAQTTPYIKFQVTENSDMFVANDPNTYTFVGDNDDTLKVVKINIIDNNFIQLQTDKRLEGNVGYALIYRRRLSDPYIKTPYYTFFGFCPGYIQTITVQQPIEIK